jgi:hypothetical protein
MAEVLGAQSCILVKNGNDHQRGNMIKALNGEAIDTVIRA